MDLQDGRWGRGQQHEIPGHWPAEPSPHKVARNREQSHPSSAARPQGGMSRGCRSRITGLALGISPGGQAGLLAQPQAPAGRAQGTRSLGLLTQGNPLQSRAGLDPGLPWRPVLEPVQASHPLLSPRAAWPGGRPRARGIADCGELRVGVRTRAHVAFSNELWV